MKLKREKSCFCSRRTRKAARDDTNTRKRKKMRREQKRKKRRNLQGPRKQELWTILRPSWRMETGPETVRAESMKNSNQSGFDIHTVWHRRVIFQSIPPVYSVPILLNFHSVCVLPALQLYKVVRGTVVHLMPFSSIFRHITFRCVYKWSTVYFVINWLELCSTKTWGNFGFIGFVLCVSLSMGLIHEIFINIVVNYE